MQSLCSYLRKETTMNLGTWIFLIIGGGISIPITLFMVMSFPAVLGWKIYRKVRFGYALYD